MSQAIEEREAQIDGEFDKWCGWSSHNPDSAAGGSMRRAYHAGWNKREERIKTLEQENAELRAKLVELALKLAAHETAEDRRCILESEDVRSIMDLRLR